MVTTSLLKSMFASQDQKALLHLGFFNDPIQIDWYM
jgi:hypothetical protein